ncbi:MAG: Uma2 family endonuclease [Acidobacteria bacterium]|nr:Uma2 family endonuclease [Acidobacteriota bacterium]
MTTPLRHAELDGDREAGRLFLALPPVVRLDDDQFYELCRLNRELRIERAAGGGLSIMPPAGGDTSRRNAEIVRQLANWASRNGAGTCFDSSCGFVLPNGAVRSPDAAWVLRERLNALTERQRSRFLPLCPDFVVELRSPTDSLPVLQDKMREYVDNGAGLGWLIDPLRAEVFVYLPDGSVECLQAPAYLSADPLLAGFRLERDEIW